MSEHGPSEWLALHRVHDPERCSSRWPVERDTTGETPSLTAPDGPLWGVRDTEQWRDTLYIGGFSTGCSATRSRKSSLLVPGDLLVAERVSGSALQVLNVVISSWSP